MKHKKLVYGIVSVLFALYALSLLVPFAYTLLNSFKTNGEFAESVWAMPSRLAEQGDIFRNYKEAMQEWNMVSMFINSVIITIGGTLAGVISPMLVSYTLAKYKFKLGGLIFTTALIFMVIPNVGTTVATYSLLLKLRLLNTYLGLILLYAGPFGGYFFMLYSYFKGISWSYAEAAYIDGAGEFTVFYKIMIPQARAGIVAIAVLSAIGVYNDYYIPYMYMPNAYTVATGLQNLSFNAETTGAYTQMFAAIIVAAVPVFSIFAVAQKTIMNNVSIGGLKG